MKLYKPNPLNVFNLRKVECPIAHFEYVNLPMKYNLEESLVKWIEKNLKGRFYINRTLAIGKSNKPEVHIKIGFENSKEMSYFNLACPHLKYM
jgi:hypothetical protein